MESPNGPARPHWDGSRILFEIIVGDEHIPCAISRAAVQGLSDRRCFKTAELLQCFAHARERIEKIALEKLGARPTGVYGTLNIWADDIDDTSPPSIPVAKTGLPAWWTSEAGTSEPELPKDDGCDASVATAGEPIEVAALPPAAKVRATRKSA